MQPSGDKQSSLSFVTGRVSVHRFKHLIGKIWGPASVGLIMALVIMLVKPQWFPALESFQRLSAADDVQSNVMSQPTSYADAVKQAAPSVVNIFTKRIVRQRIHPLFDDPLFRRFFENNSNRNDQRINSSLGSGVIMNKQGYILTNHHVISGADEIVVALQDGREAPAMLVGSDPEIDLAVLKIKLPSLPEITISNRSQLNIGDVVLAIGNPFGVGQTVTMGIISATGRNQLGLNTYENYIQTDAAINPGNSGGALINAYGELVGINSAIYSESGGSQGIGFAIPALISYQVMKDITQHGETIRGWMGIEVQEATPSLLMQLDLPQALKGLIVTGLAPHGPSELAGLKVGDIITGLNGNNKLSAKAAMNQIAALRPGDGINIDYIRAGEQHMAVAVAGQRAQPEL